MHGFESTDGRQTRPYALLRSTLADVCLTTQILKGVPAAKTGALDGKSYLTVNLHMF